MSKAGIQRLRPNSVLVVDGSYMLHRTMHLPGALSGPHGYPVGGITKVLQSLTSIVRMLTPSRVFWVHDKEHHPARSGLFPGYKEKTFKDEVEQQEAEQYRESYHYQRDMLLGWLPHFGVHVINGPYESDDSIWYLTNVLAQYQILSAIVTEDHDFAQLLSDYIWIYAPHKEVLVTRDSWTDYCKWAPDQIVMAKAILGDSSDRIPSPCQGLGTTGLRKLFEECQEYTMQHIADVVEKKFHKKKKYQTLLDSSVQEQIEINRKLIALDAGLAFTSDYERNYVWSECCARSQHNSQVVMQLLAQYEMTNLLRFYGLWMPAFQELV